jgi:hypothetical protein
MALHIADRNPWTRIAEAAGFSIKLARIIPRPKLRASGTGRSQTGLCRLDHAVDQLVALFGSGVRNRLCPLVAICWARTTHNGGADSCALPGHAAARADLAPSFKKLRGGPEASLGSRGTEQPSAHSASDTRERDQLCHRPSQCASALSLEEVLDSRCCLHERRRLARRCRVRRRLSRQQCGGQGTGLNKARATRVDPKQTSKERGLQFERPML